MQFRDYYEVLGVPRDVDEAALKKAYRKLALEWHPDRHAGPERAKAEARFKELNEAYEVLSDSAKRAKYDRFGKDWESGAPFPPPGGRAGAPQDWGEVFGDGEGFSEFFRSMFGEEYAQEVRGRTRARRRRRGTDIEAELELPLTLALAGGVHPFELPGETDCPTCSGHGELAHRMCPACAGLGRVHRRRRVELRIPAEVRDGLVLRLKGLGEPGLGGAESGDLLLRLTLGDDETYRLVDGALEARVVVAPWDAHRGLRVDVRTARGTASVTIPAHSRSGRRLRLRGQGLSDGRGGHGDFYVRIELDLPPILSEREEELLGELAELSARARGA
jgi:DnaJ-class molecular chaperone